MAETGTDIRKAAQLLAEGKLVAIPTETVYGLAANALNAEACLKIFEAKNRPAFDPLIVHIHSETEAEKYCSEYPETARRLCRTLWPGPLTVILPKKEIIPDIVTAGQPTTGLRVPSHPLTRQLLEQLPFPLAAPSANPFGYVSPTTAQHVNEQLGDAIDYILDGGPCEVGVESTIVGFSAGKISLLRLGGYTAEQIEAYTGPLAEQLNQSSNPQAPGQLEQHYAPATRFILGLPDGHTDNPDYGYLRFSEPLAGVTEQRQWILAPDASLHTAAHNLFGFMREMDGKKFTAIFAEYAPETGLGRAINDRLRRASAKGLSPE